VEELIGQSKPLQQIRRRIRQLSKTRVNVLLLGEHGVGKSVVARNIHLHSASASKPFVHIATDTMDELSLRSVAQNILTKHEFKNPATSQHGNFQLSEGSTLILDNVEKLTATGQKVVLDLLKGLENTSANIRIMLLLTLPPRNLIKKESLINGFVSVVKNWQSVSVPPLRERREDIPDLIEHFVRQATAELDMGEMIMDINAVSLLTRKEWKGNIQELKAFVEQALLLSTDREIFTLPPSLIDEQSELSAMIRRIDEGVGFALDRSMELIERRILERVLRKFGFNQSKAARFLKITEDTLRYRMKKLGIRAQHEGS